jgi:hypothetical protein
MNPDMRLGQDCYIVRDADGHALAYVYFEDEPGRRSHLLTRDEARRIAANIVKLPGATDDGSHQSKRPTGESGAAPAAPRRRTMPTSWPPALLAGAIF